MTPGSQFESLWNEYFKHKSKFSTSLEIDEMQSRNAISADVFLDISNTTDALERDIMTLVPKWEKEFSRKAAKENGKPVLVIVCASAIRCVQVIKYVSSLVYSLTNW